MSENGYKSLSVGQRNHWERQLEDAQRSVEVALRMLGRLPLEEVELNIEHETNTEVVGTQGD